MGDNLKNILKSNDNKLLYKWLKDPYAQNCSDTAYKILKNKSNLSVEQIGALYFYLFSYTAEQIAIKNEDKYDTASDEYRSALKRANLFLHNHETIDFISNFYSITYTNYEDHKYEMTLHKVGTSSFIFVIDSLNLVIKCIKPRYLDSPKIMSDTLDYKKQFSSLDFENKYTPKILETTQQYIIMDYIRGYTLREYVNKRIKSDRTKIDIDKLIVVWKQLCGKLKKFADNGIYHMDLSPENILVSEEIDDNGIDRPNIYLIDFGCNNLLIEGIGTSSALLKAQLYIAPELFKNRDLSTYKKYLIDLYSLGMILLEIVSKKELNSQNMIDQIDKIQMEYIGLGQILEEMLDIDQSTRLEFYSQSTQIYDEINQKISDELDVYNRFYTKSGNKLLNIVDTSLHYCFSVNKLLTGIREFIYLRENKIKRYKDLKHYLGWLSLTHILNMFVIYNFYQRVKELNSTEEWLSNFPGYIVALTFSFVATQYYVQIYSQIEHNKSKFTNFWLRFNSFCFSIPVLYLIIIDPKPWPFGAAIGVFFVSMNNIFNFRLAKKAKCEIERIYAKKTLAMTYDNFFDTFKSWGPVTLAYSFLLIILGMLLNHSFRITDKITINLQDEWAYAIIVVFLTIKMYAYNCTTLAPMVRSGLEKLYIWHEKALKHLEEIKLKS